MGRRGDRIGKKRMLTFDSWQIGGSPEKQRLKRRKKTKRGGGEGELWLNSGETQEKILKSMNNSTHQGEENPISKRDSAHSGKG